MTQKLILISVEHVVVCTRTICLGATGWSAGVGAGSTRTVRKNALLMLMERIECVCLCNLLLSSKLLCCFG